MNKTVKIAAVMTIMAAFAGSSISAKTIIGKVNGNDKVVVKNTTKTVPAQNAAVKESGSKTTKTVTKTSANGVTKTVTVIETTKPNPVKPANAKALENKGKNQKVAKCTCHKNHGKKLKAENKAKAKDKLRLMKTCEVHSKKTNEKVRIHAKEMRHDSSCNGWAK